MTRNRIDFIAKKTSELTMEEKRAICVLFQDVFAKVMTINEFDIKFLNNDLGYSFHCMMVLENGSVVGCYSTIPCKYDFFGKELIFGLSVDTMISKCSRGTKGALFTMSEKVYALLQHSSIPFVFGFPNENAYMVRKKRLLWEDIGILKFYVLPIKIGALHKKLALFNVFSSGYSSIVNKLAKKRAVVKMDADLFGISKIHNNNYLEKRFTREKYFFNYLNNNCFYIAKIEVEDETKVLYILDVNILCKENLENAVQDAYYKYRDAVDAIIYVGNLTYIPINLIQIPKKFVPKSVYMSGRILDNKLIDSRIFNLTSWNVNLSNYDVR